MFALVLEDQPVGLYPSLAMGLDSLKLSYTHPVTIMFQDDYTVVFRVHVSRGDTIGFLQWVEPSQSAHCVFRDGARDNTPTERDQYTEYLRDPGNPRVNWHHWKANREGTATVIPPDTPEPSGD